MPDFLPILNTIVLALIGGGGVWLWRAEKRVKLATAEVSEVDAAAKIKDLSLGLLKPLEAKISALEEEIKELRFKLETYVQQEAYFELIIERKDDRIEALEAELDGAHKDRELLHREVATLKGRLANAGINGEETHD